MDRKYMMRAEKAKALSAFMNEHGFTAYEEKLETFFGQEELPELYPGQEIVLCGYIGMAGTVYLAEHKEEELRTVLPKHFIRSAAALKDLEQNFPEPKEAAAHGVKAMYAVTEGGLLHALCELAHDCRTGFRIDYEEVPVKQVTIECCEVFDLNPWQMMSGGCVLMVTDHGYETVRAFEKEQIPCKVIGYISDNQDKLICHGEIHSHLNRPGQDELLKIFEK